MADPIGVSAATITLASAAYKSCQKLRHAIDGLGGAHEQIRTLSSDLESFYLVLGTLQATLQEKASSPAMVEPSMSNSLSKALGDSMDVFKKINASVVKYQDHDHDHALRLGILQRAKWTLDEKKIQDLKNELSQRKMTLCIAVSAVNVMSTNQIQSEMMATKAAAVGLEAQMEEHLELLHSKIAQQQEDILALGLPAPIRHSEEDRKTVKTDCQLTLRRFVGSDAASTSSDRTPSTPSFEISSFEAVASDAASIISLPRMSPSFAPADKAVHGEIRARIFFSGPINPISFRIASKGSFCLGYIAFLAAVTVPLREITEYENTKERIEISGPLHYKIIWALASFLSILSMARTLIMTRKTRRLRREHPSKGNSIIREIA